MNSADFRDQSARKVFRVLEWSVLCSVVACCGLLLGQPNRLPADDLPDDMPQTAENKLTDDVRVAAEKFLERIETPVPKPGKKARRKRLHRRNDQGEIVDLRLRDIALAEDDLLLVGKLKYLETLDLRSTNIIDDQLKLLAGLENLRELVLDDTAIDGSGVSTLNGLKELKKLSLRGTEISDATFKEIQLPDSLRELNLRDTGITDTGLQQRTPIDSIEVLRLGDTKITDAGLSQLKHWKSLMGVTLDRTSVTEEGLTKFSEQEKFQWMRDAEATVKELVRRLEAGEHSAVAAMCSPGVNVPERGRLKLTKLESIEQSDADRERKRHRYQTKFEWTLEAGNLETLYINLRVECGTVFLLEIGIEYNSRSPQS